MPKLHPTGVALYVDKAIVVVLSEFGSIRYVVEAVGLVDKARTVTLHSTTILNE